MLGFIIKNTKKLMNKTFLLIHILLWKNNTKNFDRFSIFN